MLIAVAGKHCFVIMPLSKTVGKHTTQYWEVLFQLYNTGRLLWWNFQKQSFTGRYFFEPRVLFVNLQFLDYAFRNWDDHHMGGNPNGFLTYGILYIIRRRRTDCHSSSSTIGVIWTVGTWGRPTIRPQRFSFVLAIKDKNNYYIYKSYKLYHWHSFLYWIPMYINC